MCHEGVQRRSTQLVRQRPTEWAERTGRPAIVIVVADCNNAPLFAMHRQRPRLLLSGKRGSEATKKSGGPKKVSNFGPL